MYAAISGLKSHMEKLNVIGNNIANVNTYGYKSGRTVFQTELYTTLKTGSDGTTTAGSKNPSQIGYGSSVGSIDIDMSTGTYSPTGKATDCMIDGDGFFLVGDKDLTFEKADDLTKLTLTRVGNFEFKADGYLTDGQGNVVYGFLTTGVDSKGNAIVGSQLVPIRYPGYDTTKDEVLYPTVDANASNKLNSPTVKDANGDETEAPFAQFDSVSIDGTTGKITATCKDNNKVVTIGYIAIGNVTNPNGVTQETGTYYKAGDGSGTLSVALLGGVADELKLTSINAAAATTTNNGAATTTANTTTSTGLEILSGGTTSLITGGLESSKTDLATEISEMITTQRGYQANTRIITVTDSMLEELVNMKR
jgi:flagellar hook protein FlgE